MTATTFVQFQYWLDIGIKAIIGIGIALIGADYKAVKDMLHDLEGAKNIAGSERAVLTSIAAANNLRLDRIESKIDRIIEREK